MEWELALEIKGDVTNIFKGLCSLYEDGYGHETVIIS